MFWVDEWNNPRDLPAGTPVAANNPGALLSLIVVDTMGPLH